MIERKSLSEAFPQIAKEAHGWDPEGVSSYSSKKVEWCCSKMHIYSAVIANRTANGSGCPYCSGNKVLAGFNDLASNYPDLAMEAHGWDPSQVTIGSGKKVSWKCNNNHTWEASPNNRTSNASGCPFCSNNKVWSGFNDLATLNPEVAEEALGWDSKLVGPNSNKRLLWKCSSHHEWLARPADRLRGDGCPYCSGRKVLLGFNDLATTHPDLALQANGWNPQDFTYGSNQRKKWICAFGHGWVATPANRAISGTGCPYCSGNKVLEGFNDLNTTHPHLASQAVKWKPNEISFGSNKKVKWFCENGHEWIISPKVRTGKDGSDCPSCAQTGFDPNKEGWLYFLWHPDWEMLQIGITNVPADRLKTHKSLGWKVLELRGPMNGDLARQWEADILRMLRKRNAVVGTTDIAGKFTGYTESWMKSSFPASSLKELMECVRLMEEQL
jgi:hypothetical protein